MTVNKLKRDSTAIGRSTASKKKKSNRFKVLLGPALAGLMTVGCFSDPGPAYSGHSTDSGSKTGSTTGKETDTGSTTVTETDSTSDTKTDNTSNTETSGSMTSSSDTTTSDTETTSSSSEALCEGAGPDFFDGLIGTDTPQIVGGYRFVYKGQNASEDAIFDIFCEASDAVVAADMPFPEGEITTLPVPADGMQISIECFSASDSAANVEIAVEPL